MTDCYCIPFLSHQQYWPGCLIHCQICARSAVRKCLAHNRSVFVIQPKWTIFWNLNSSRSKTRDWASTAIIDVCEPRLKVVQIIIGHFWFFALENSKRNLCSRRMRIVILRYVLASRWSSLNGNMYRWGMKLKMWFGTNVLPVDQSWTVPCSFSSRSLIETSGRQQISNDRLFMSNTLICYMIFKF